MRLQLSIAVTHLLARKRQTLVSLSGIVLGTAFFLAVSALMQGSEKDFIKRLVDNSPHITVSDEYRGADIQPAAMQWPDAAVNIRSIKPQTEVRGIRGYQQKLAFIESIPGLRVAPALTGSVVLTFAGRVQGVSMTGLIPESMREVSSIEDKIIEGSLEALNANPNGIIVGIGLINKFKLALGRNVTVTTSDGIVRSMKIVGIFRTGTANYDETQTYALLKKVQSLLNRPNRVNRFVIQLSDPNQARDVATLIEQRIGYKSVSWLEASEDIMSLLTVRNIIMYSVVTAILVVAAFGIYNTISTIVMEKTRDIAIMKSMGFHASDIQLIFLSEGLIVGLIGSLLGIAVGLGLMWILDQVVLPITAMGGPTHLPVYRGQRQFFIAFAFALFSAVAASYLPANKGGRVHPVDVLRGSM